jgi:phage terminase large subunit-like protein
MIATPGNIIDFNRIEADIPEATTRFQVGEIAYDPWQATQLATRLQTQGARVIEFRCRHMVFEEQFDLDEFLKSAVMI